MSQLPLRYGRLHTVDEEFTSSMVALRDLCTQAGNLVVAGATGIDESDLPKMFKPGSGRHLRYSAVFSIGALDVGSRDQRRRALEPLARSWGLEIVEPRPALTIEEQRDIMLEYIRSQPHGADLERVLLGGRR